MIVRLKKRENPYVVIDKAILCDEKLSWKARGLAAYLLSKPDDWSINERHLATCGPDGAAAVRSGLKELEQAGYLKRDRKRAEDGTFAWEATLYETPQPCRTFPHMDYPRVDEPVSEKPRVDNRPILSNVLPNNEEGGIGSTPSQQPAPAKPQGPPPQPLLAELTNDPYMDAAVNKFNRQQQGRAAHPGQIPMDDWNKQVPAAQRIPLLKVIADLTGKRPLWESDDVKIARLLHEAAIKAHKWGYTPESLLRLEGAWISDWRSGGKRAGRIDQFMDFLSEKKTESAPSPTMQPQRRTIARGGYAWS